MSTEEIYFRSFATAGALASVVAFFADDARDSPPTDRPSRRSSIAVAAGIVFVWSIAHHFVRGSGTGRVDLWPPDVTKRFPALTACGLIAGMCVSWLERFPGVTWSTIRAAARLGAMGALALVLTEPMRHNGASMISIGAACGAITLVGAAWWWMIEIAGNRGSGPLLLFTLAVIVLGGGAVAGALASYSLGYVAIMGGPILVAAGLWAVRNPAIARGPVLGATVASSLMVVLASAYLYVESPPVAPVAVMIGAPATVLISVMPGCAGRSRGVRWGVQLGVACAAAGAAVMMAMAAWNSVFGVD